YSKSGLLGFHRIKDAEVDKLIEKGMELESTKNFKGAAEKYKTAPKRAIDELVSLCPVVFQKHVVIAKKNVKNFSPFPHYWMFYNGDPDNLLVNVRWEKSLSL
ncbi:MAG: Oligopeptide-binding protein AppA, partial [Thermacetogenium phaeum]